MTLAAELYLKIKKINIIQILKVHWHPPKATRTDRISARRVGDECDRVWSETVFPKIIVIDTYKHKIIKYCPLS